MGTLIDMSGKKIGLLTVIELVNNDKRGTYWRCVCDCGAKTIVSGRNLRRGHTKSCGCLKIDLLRARGGKNHPNWKGGRHKDTWGYVLVMQPKHPRANNRGYVLEHILVWEEAYGPMPKGATIHHINGVHDDNRIENLELRTHVHPPGQRVEDMIPFCINYLKKYRPDMPGVALLDKTRRVHPWAS